MRIGSIADIRPLSILKTTYRAFGSEHIFSLFHCNFGYYILNINVNIVYLCVWDVGEKPQVEELTAGVDNT